MYIKTPSSQPTFYPPSVNYIKNSKLTMIDIERHFEPHRTTCWVSSIP